MIIEFIRLLLNDGYVSKDVAVDICKTTIERLDVNNDGLISIGEIVKCLITTLTKTKQ